MAATATGAALVGASSAIATWGPYLLGLLGAIFVAGTAHEVVEWFQEMGSKDIKIKKADGTEVNVSATPMTAEQDATYEGQPVTVLAAGATTTDGETVEFNAAGTWSAMPLQSAVAGVLYATGIAINAETFNENEEAKQKFINVCNAVKGYTWEVVEGADGIATVPALIAADGTFSLMKEFVQAVVTAALAEGLYPYMDPTVDPGEFIQPVFLFGSIMDLAAFNAEQLQNGGASSGQIAGYMEMMQAIQQALPSDLNLAHDLVTVSTSLYTMNNVQVNVFRGMDFATVLLLNTTGEHAIWNQDARVPGADATSGGNQLTIARRGAGGDIIPGERITLTGWWTGHAWYGQPTITTSTYTQPVTVGPNTYAASAAMGVSAISIGTAKYLPVDGYDHPADFIIPESGSIDVDFPDWGGTRVTSMDGTETVDFLNLSVLVDNPVLTGTLDINLDQDEAQSGTIIGTMAQEMVQSATQAITQALTVAHELLETATVELPVGAPLPSSVPPVVTPVGAADTGMAGLYQPTKAQLQAFSQWLWTDTGLIDAMKKLFASPIDGIISLYKVYAAPVVTGNRAIQCGYVASPVSANTVDQYTYVNCGTIAIPKYFYNCLDYNPYSKIQLFLPFVGFVDLDIDDCVGGNISIRYGVDVLTGACLASITITRDGIAPILYTFEGNCGVSLPITSGEKTRYIAQTVAGAAGVVGSAVSGNLLGTIASAASVASNKVRINHSGNLSANAGAFGPRVPYVVISRPTQADAVGFNRFYGVPANKTLRLSACVGFTRVKDVILDAIPATDAEKTEIRNILTDGVII